MDAFIIHIGNVIIEATIGKAAMMTPSNTAPNAARAASMTGVGENARRKKKEKKRGKKKKTRERIVSTCNTSVWFCWKKWKISHSNDNILIRQSHNQQINK
tara:strand:- start:734 stop:1036 length:303 start_codon:yes stop_codon:yes gene_type:complete